MCTFKRGFGKAVERNRVRRVFKEIYRQNKSCFKNSFDIVLLLSKGFSKVDVGFETQVASFVKVFKRADLFECVNLRL